MKKLLMLPVLLLSAFTIIACDNDDEGIHVSPEFESAFRTLYPQVSRINWEREGNYYIADFWRGDLNAEAEAWFNTVAAWEMTVTEINYAGLPQPVKDAFSSGSFNTWRVEDVDMVERAGMETVYILEVESGNLEFDLYYTGDGVLVKEIPNSEGNNNPSHYLPGETPSSINEYITTHYPNAKIVEIDREAGGIEVDILDGRTHRDLFFTVSGEWQYTKTEVSRSEIPQTITAAFNQSAYSSYRIDDIDWYQTTDSEFYLFELDSEPEDIHIRIYPDGTIEERRGY